MAGRGTFGPKRIFMELKISSEALAVPLNSSYLDANFWRVRKLTLAYHQLACFRSLLCNWINSKSISAEIQFPPSACRPPFIIWLPVFDLLLARYVESWQSQR